MFKSIVIATDGSETATLAVREAVDLAQAVGARLEIVSVYEAEHGAHSALPPEQEVETALANAADIARQAGVAVGTHACQGDPADTILAVAEELGADLVIVGNKGMTGARRFLLGSVPNKLSHHATGSVLIVRTT